MSKLTEAQQADIRTWRNFGYSLNKIVSLLESEFGLKVSRETLRLWLKKHNKVTNPWVKVSKDWEPRIELEGDSGTVVTPLQENGEISDFTDILKEIDSNLINFEVIGPVKVSKWQTFNGDWLTAYKLNIQKRTKEDFDLPTLFQEVKNNLIISEVKKEEIASKREDRTLVVPFSDPQFGKVNSRGNTKDLLERIFEKKEKLKNYIDQQNCSSAVFLDGGDIVESFENTSQQLFLNDISIMGQLDLAGTIEQEFITLLAETHDSVIAAGVPSNHGAWRRGKDILGKPSDDWGLFLLKQIQKAYQLAPDNFGHVTFQYPEKDWDKSIRVEVQGIGIGLVHGEDSSLAQMQNWWAKQVHGNTPVAKTDLLITAHYHTFGLNPSGRSLVTDRQKWWLSLPTLDNGSAWYSYKNGADSDPGLVAFVIDKEIGFDLQSFTIL